MQCVMDFEDLWSWIPGMARPLTAGGEDGLQICRVKLKVKVKFNLEQATKVQRGSRGIALLSLMSALDGGWWSTPRPGRFTPGERPATYCIVGWVGHRAGLDGFGKSQPCQDSILVQSSPWRIAIPTELSRPIQIWRVAANILNKLVADSRQEVVLQLEGRTRG